MYLGNDHIAVWVYSCINNVEFKVYFIEKSGKLRKYDKIPGSLPYSHDSVDDSPCYSRQAQSVRVDNELGPNEVETWRRQSSG